MSSNPNPAPPPPESAQRARHISRGIGRVLFVLFCLELGILLVVVPWLPLYDRNILFYIRPEWSPYFLHNYFRAALNGLGFLNFFISLSEILAFFGPKERR